MATNLGRRTACRRRAMSWSGRSGSPNDDASRWPKLPDGRRLNYKRAMDPSDASPAGKFPATRLRRLRYHPAVCELVREVRLSPQNLVLPVFARPGRGEKRAIASMPGPFQLSTDLVAAEVREAAQLGLGGVLLFGIPAEKDAQGSDSCSDSGIVQQAIRSAKQAVPDVLVITDVCFCEYTSHGHCGVVNETTG